jgi:hypothetical protein
VEVLIGVADDQPVMDELIYRQVVRRMVRIVPVRLVFHGSRVVVCDRFASRTATLTVRRRNSWRPSSRWSGRGRQQWDAVVPLTIDNGPPAPITGTKDLLPNHREGCQLASVN